MPRILLSVALFLVAGCSSDSPSATPTTRTASATDDEVVAKEKPKAASVLPENSPNETEPAPTVVVSDHEKLQGSWQRLTLETDGELLEDPGPAKWVFEGDIVDTHGLKYQFTLDSSTSPKQLTLQTKIADIVLESGFKCIYRLEEDALTICMAGSSREDRPTDFSTAAENHRHLISFRRAKPISSESKVELDPTLLAAIEHSLVLLKENRLEEYARYSMPPAELDSLDDDQWNEGLKILATRREALIAVYESLDMVEPTVADDTVVFDLSGYEIGNDVPVGIFPFKRIDGRWYLGR